MSTLVKEQQEIDLIVKDILADFDGQKNIDAVDIFNKPDKREVQELVKNLFKIVYPGYFRDKSFKIYNPHNSYAVIIEDAFYHLNKQVFLALDFCKKRGTMTEDDRRKESYYFKKKNYGWSWERRKRGY